MGAIELREELRKYIELEDTKLLNTLHEAAVAYLEQKELDRLIEEGEDDIREGRVHSQEEVQQMIENWIRE